MCSQDNTDSGDTIRKALLARGDQGFHETEVSFRGEKDLSELSEQCLKNPNHANFIPVKNLNLDSLPQGYRDEEIIDFIKCQADLTVKLVCFHTSLSRPQDYPFYTYRGQKIMRIGTGFVQYVYRNDVRSGASCPCPDCATSSAPYKKWFKVKIRTATHVIFDHDEASQCKVELFFDDEEERGRIRILHAETVRFNAEQGDWCDMRFVTHDTELKRRLKQTWAKWRWLETKINHKYADKDPHLAVIVSHPHGNSKQVTFGQWMERIVVDCSRDYESCIYTYDTPTCPGCSGAPVWILGKVRLAGFFGRHPHSGGSPCGLNRSAVGWERKLKPD